MLVLQGEVSEHHIILCGDKKVVQEDCYGTTVVVLCRLPGVRELKETLGGALSRSLATELSP